MQLVSLEDLKKLANPVVAEASSEIVKKLSFKDICKVYAMQKEKAEAKLGNAYFQKNWPLSLSAWLKSEYLVDRCPPIALVGDGSSRTAYACLGGKCLKVAKSLAGVAQNKQEEKHTKKHWWKKGYECFAQSYAASKDYGLLLTECCAKIEKPSQLAEALGMDDIDVLRAVVKAVCDDKKHDPSSASSALRAMATDLKQKGKDFQAMQGYAIVAEAAAEWLDQFGKTAAAKLTPGQRSFYSLILFWTAEGTDELMPSDVIRDENWGFAIRNGKIAPVILDAGFSKEVAKQFYTTDVTSSSLI